MAENEKNITLVEFSRYFKETYTARNMTKAELSRLSKVSEATLSRIESGTQLPSPKTLKKLAPHLMVSEKELMIKAGYLPNAEEVSNIEHEETLKQIKPYIIQLCNNSDFLDKLAISMGKKIPFDFISIFMNKMSFEKLIEFICSIGFNFNGEEDKDGNVNFWLGSMSNLSAEERNSLKGMDKLVPINDIYPLEPKLVNIPIVGKVSCGTGVLAIEEIEGYEPTPKNWLNGGEYFYTRAKGDSMINARINDGDLVLIRKQPDVEDGEIAAIVVDDHIFLKRVYKRNGTIILQSENNKYPPQIFSNNNTEKCYIVGKLKKVVINY